MAFGRTTVQTQQVCWPALTINFTDTDMFAMMLIGSSISALAQDDASAMDAVSPADIQDVFVELTPDRPDSDAIINGESATEDDYPMTGGMLMSGVIFGYAFDTLVCSSTLIAPDVVLIAAHCLDEFAFTFGLSEIEDKQIWWTRQADLTEWDGQTRNPDLPADAVEMSGYVIHEDFDIQQMQIGIAENHDIALLFLSEALTDVPIAYLPTADEATQIAEGDAVAVVGWGQQVATGAQEAPPSGTYAIKMQGESYISELGPMEFQVGLLEDDVRKCHGDSGGPSFVDVVTDSTETMRLIGVTSHAYDMTDCNETGGVDTRVDAYLEWIDDQMVAACDDGTRVWCDDVTGILPPPEPALAGDTGDGKDGGKGCSALGGSAGAGLALLASGMLGLRRRQGMV